LIGIAGLLMAGQVTRHAEHGCGFPRSQHLITEYGNQLAMETYRLRGLFVRVSAA
jgi:hypothetical protein